jgi:hypothetical protein
MGASMPYAASSSEASSIPSTTSSIASARAWISVGGLRAGAMEPADDLARDAITLLFATGDLSRQLLVLGP